MGNFFSTNASEYLQMLLIDSIVNCLLFVIQTNSNKQRDGLTMNQTIQ